jgi:hypothetical protein
MCPAENFILLEISATYGNHLPLPFEAMVGRPSRFALDILKAGR